MFSLCFSFFSIIFTILHHFHIIKRSFKKRHHIFNRRLRTVGLRRSTNALLTSATWAPPAACSSLPDKASGLNLDVEMRLENKWAEYDHQNVDQYPEMSLLHETENTGSEEVWTEWVRGSVP